MPFSTSKTIYFTQFYAPFFVEERNTIYLNYFLVYTFFLMPAESVCEKCKWLAAAGTPLYPTCLNLK